VPSKTEVKPMCASGYSPPLDPQALPFYVPPRDPGAPPAGTAAGQAGVGEA
jgi:hypothetical protein